MSFWDFKKKALKFKDDIIGKWAKKLWESSMVIKKIDNLNKFIEKSQTKSFTSKETGETKEFIKKVIVVFAEKESSFFEKLLIWLPVLATKAFSQNIPFKICDIDIKDLWEYKIKEQPCLVVFETEKVIKIIEWEENISKIIKKLDIDIIKAIEEN